jgi:hypothetical protein
MTPLAAAHCRHCRRELDDEPRRPRRSAVEATDFLIPTNVSGWALASCYLGLIGFCVPVLGLPFALLAVVFGIIAVRRQKDRAETYGEVTGNIRAVVGLILGGLGIVISAGLLVFILATEAFK